jgi:hypothetical protein
MRNRPSRRALSSWSATTSMTTRATACRRRCSRRRTAVLDRLVARRPAAHHDTQRGRDRTRSPAVCHYTIVARETGRIASDAIAAAWLRDSRYCHPLKAVRVRADRQACRRGMRSPRTGWPPRGWAEATSAKPVADGCAFAGGGLLDGVGGVRWERDGALLSNGREEYGSTPLRQAGGWVEVHERCTRLEHNGQTRANRVDS